MVEQLEGFGEHKQEAISLLKKVISILNNENINHFLISGTLLGYVRHSDFIPWDDDIDLLVDESIYDKIYRISEKNDDINIFYKKEQKYDSIKICFSNGFEIEENDSVRNWKENCITKDDKYCWPFIDLFVYETGPGIHNCSEEPKEKKIGGNNLKFYNPFNGPCRNSFRLFSENEISFFHNEWNINEFFPPKNVNLLGVDCNIPRNPDYFLSNNYGKDYMTNIVLPNIIHKTEKDRI